MHLGLGVLRRGGTWLLLKSSDRYIKTAFWARDGSHVDSSTAEVSGVAYWGCCFKEAKGAEVNDSVAFWETF